MGCEVIVNSLRVQFLSDEIVRVEYAENAEFFGSDSLFIPNRGEFTGWSGFAVRGTTSGTSVLFSGYELCLPASCRSLKGVVLKKGTDVIYAFGEEKNTGELPPLSKTPEVFAVADTPRVTLPEGGYSVFRKGEFRIEEQAQDVYLLMCKGDFKTLRRLYVQLTGRTPLPRLATFGAWNSKYFKYDENSAKQVILDYEKYDIPLDNIVLDTDWRAASDRGIGYDIDTALFPDMRRFFEFAHAHGVEVMFNDHPEPVDGAKDLLDPAEVKYREEKLQGLLELGLDTWWYDRNWSTKLISPVKGIRPETFGMYVFEEITKHFYENKAGNREKYRRPVIMANVNEIANGNYIAVKDSASHRFGIQWTGDIPSDSVSLATEVKTLIRASENEISYVNADCGGHLGNPDKELYLRWIQFGVLSPVFRPHCTNTVLRFREPWLYDEETVAVARSYIRMRYRLLPMLYAAAFENYRSGTPIFRGLGWEYPEDKKVAACVDSYLLGKDILVAPVVGILPQPLEEDKYCAPVTAVYFDGKERKGEPLAEAQMKKLDLFLDGTSPAEGVPVCNFSARFETQVRFDGDVKLFLCCDDGATVYLDGVPVFRDDTIHSAMTFPLGIVSGGCPHAVRVDYFQAGGEAVCRLCYADVSTTENRVLSLPEGKWMDVFDGAVFHGGEADRSYAYDEMPLFVRLGALIPLARDAKNTKEQRWDELAFDYYPAEETSDEGILYEDDGETTAYQKGEFRISPYRARYDAKEKCYVVCFEPSEGVLFGERAVAERKLSVRFHCIGGIQVSSVSLNGEEIAYRMIARDRGAFPFAAEGGARDSEIACVKFCAKCDKAYELKIKLD